MTGAEFREKMGKDFLKLAEDIACNITIRTYDTEGSHDEKRRTTKPEYEIIKNIVFSAFLTYGYDAETKPRWNSVLSMAEFTLIQFIPEANAYDTIYIPLRNITETW